MALRRCVAILACWLAIAACSARPAARPPGGTGGSGPEGAGGSGATGAAGSGGSGCSDAAPPVIVDGDDCLDFHGVPLGLDRTLDAEVRNLSREPVSVCIASSDPAFDVDTTQLDLPAAGTARVPVRFFPPQRGSYLGDLLLARCHPCSPRAGVIHACMQGFAAIECFTIEPSPVEFGTQQVGSRTCRTVTLRSACDLPVYVRDIRMDDGLKRVPGTFDLGLGDILNNKEIKPGESADFQLCFSPQRLGADYSGSLVIYTDSQQQKVAVHGRVGGPCMMAVPASLDLGTTVQGIEVGARVVVVNGCEPSEVVVTQVLVEPADGSLSVSYPALPYNAGEDEGFAIDVLFRPEEASLDGHVRVALQQPGEIAKWLDIPVRARVMSGSPCELTVPEEVRLSVDPGGSETRRIELVNDGTEACWTWGVELADGGDPGFSLVSPPVEPVEIEPGAVLGLYLRYDRGDADTGARTELLYRRMVAPGEDPLARIPVVNAP